VKVGDKLLCKKDIEYTSIKNGNLCSVEEITEDKIVIKFDHRTRYYINLSSKLIAIDVPSFAIYKYFYTEKEVRKLKIQKLNENNISLC